MSWVSNLGDGYIEYQLRTRRNNNKDKKWRYKGRSGNRYRKTVKGYKSLGIIERNASHRKVRQKWVSTSTIKQGWR